MTSDLAIYHPWAGLADRQRLYALLAQETGWRIGFITASAWKDEYGNLVRPAPLELFQGRMQASRLLLSGNIPLHVLMTSVRSRLKALDPARLYIYHEPYGVATFQMAQASLALGIPFGVRSSQNISKRYPAPIRAMESAVYRNAGFAVVVSGTVADVLRSRGFDKPIHVVPMAVDTTFYGDGRVPSKSDDGRARTASLLFVGRLVPEKGLSTLLEALATLSPDQGTLTVAGTGPFDAALRRQADDLGVGGRVSWLGSIGRDALREAYARADLLVVPSVTTDRWMEQFGRVVLEAAACGTPSAVSSSGELPAVAASLGMPLIFTEEDSRDLARLLGSVLSDRALLVEAGQTAKAKVAHLYSEAAIAKQLAIALSDGAV